MKGLSETIAICVFCCCAQNRLCTLLFVYIVPNGWNMQRAGVSSCINFGPQYTHKNVKNGCSERVPIWSVFFLLVFNPNETTRQLAKPLSSWFQPNSHHAEARTSPHCTPTASTAGDCEGTAGVQGESKHANTAIRPIVPCDIFGGIDCIPSA